MTPPDVVLVDANQTLFSLEPVRARMAAAGLAPHDLEVWFAEVLRDGFALATTGRFAAFPDIAAHHLGARLRGRHGDATAAVVRDIIGGFQEVTPHPDVAPAFALLRGAGVRIAPFTNGTPEIARGFLERAGLLDQVAATLAVADAGIWKPHRDAYRYAVAALDADAASTAMVAVHPWDVHGAAEAGLVATWVNRTDAAYPPFMHPPAVTALSLTAAAERLLSR